MDFAFSEEQEMLRSSTRDFLAKEVSSKVVRKLMEADGSYDEGLWRKISGLGWTALGIPEQYGGVGTFLDLIVVLEEAGRALMPGPFFATMGLAVPALIEAGTEAQKKTVLGAIASGDARATLAFKRALEWATAVDCAEMIGGAKKVLESSSDCARTRHQFGKPIGIYQAVS